MSRAEPLKASLFRQPVGPGELEIPSIRGVGGSLLYFVRGDGENWSRDFEPVTAAPKGHSLTAVDHISQSMPHGDMLSWALFYGGVLDLKRLPQQEVADPVGLVQSQAFINEDDSVRMVLNGSAASRTSSARVHLRAARLGRPAHRIHLERYLRDSCAHTRAGCGAPGHP